MLGQPNPIYQINFLHEYALIIKIYCVIGSSLSFYNSQKKKKKSLSFHILKILNYLWKTMKVKVIKFTFEFGSRIRISPWFPIIRSGWSELSERENWLQIFINYFNFSYIIHKFLFYFFIFINYILITYNSMSNLLTYRKIR